MLHPLPLAATVRAATRSLLLNATANPSLCAFTHDPSAETQRSPPSQFDFCKTRLVPVTSELMTEHMKYRKADRLVQLPVQGETEPLLVPIIGPSKPMARSALHEIVKAVFRDSAECLRPRGPEYKAAAAHIAQASTHWMHHTWGINLSRKTDF